MAYFNEENTIEQMLINAAAQRGWIYVEPKFVPRLPDEVLVEIGRASCRERVSEAV